MTKKVLVPGLTFLGCTLLLMGNALPWPCSPGVWYSILCDASLEVYFVDELLVMIFIAAMTLLLMLEVNLLEPPMSYLAWASYWIILYLLMIAKLRQDATFLDFYYTWVRYTRNLVTLAVTPLSLVLYWLALRPKDKRQAYRTWFRLCLFVLIPVTVFLLLFAMMALHLSLRYSFEVMSAVKSAPLVILAGTVLLWGADYVETRSEPQNPMPDDKDEESEPESDE